MVEVIPSEVAAIGSCISQILGGYSRLISQKLVSSLNGLPFGRQCSRSGFLSELPHNISEVSLHVCSADRDVFAFLPTDHAMKFAP